MSVRHITKHLEDIRRSIMVALLTPVTRGDLLHLETQSGRSHHGDPSTVEIGGQIAGGHSRNIRMILLDGQCEKVLLIRCKSYL